MFDAMAASITALALMLVVGPRFIAWLRKNEVGQNIREEGPEGHKTKAGTPTMGGVLIWIAVVVPYIIFSRFTVASFTVLVCTLGCAFIGFLDDWLSVVRKRSLGCRRAGRCSCSCSWRCWSVSWRCASAGVDMSLDLPFTDQVWQLPTVLYYFIVWITISGFSNAVNLTDGLDGLAAGSGTIVLVAMAGIAFILGRQQRDPGMTDLMILAGCIGGACLGFLWFNTFPAEVFMGDTGSLGLGGAIAGMAILTKTEIFILIIAGLFVVEALSVIVQVVSFKLFHRRVLLMAPLHHHFELKAWSETKIIVRFWIIAALFAGAGFALYYASF